MSQEIQDQLKDAGKNTSKIGRWFSRAYFVALFGLLTYSLYWLLESEYLNLDIVLQANIKIGWILEGLVGAIAGLIVLFSAALLVKAVGGSLLSKLVGIIATVADNYQLERDDK
jgi:hypothetical protein